MDAIEISDDEVVSVHDSDDSDDEPINVQIVRLQRKRPGSPIVITDDESSDGGDADKVVSNRPSTDREVSPVAFNLDDVRLPSSDDELGDELGTKSWDSALELRLPNNMIPGEFRLNYFGDVMSRVLLGMTSPILI